MGATAWKALSAALIALFAVMFVISVAGGCNSMVELATGATTPMKCHWTFVAERFVTPLGALAALLALASPTLGGRRVACVMAAAVALAAFIFPTPFGIGICASAEMGCHVSGWATWALSAVAFVLAVAMAVKADPQAAAKPKRSL